MFVGNLAWVRTKSAGVWDCLTCVSILVSLHPYGHTVSHSDLPNGLSSTHLWLTSSSRENVLIFAGFNPTYLEKPISHVNKLVATHLFLCTNSRMCVVYLNIFASAPGFKWQSISDWKCRHVYNVQCALSLSLYLSLSLPNHDISIPLIFSSSQA